MGQPQDGMRIGNHPLQRETTTTENGRTTASITEEETFQSVRKNRRTPQGYNWLRRCQMAAHAGLVSWTITVWRAAQSKNRHWWTAPSFPRKATGVVHQLSAPVRQHLSIRVARPASGGRVRLSQGASSQSAGTPTQAHRSRQTTSKIGQNEKS